MFKKTDGVFVEADVLSVKCSLRSKPDKLCKTFPDSIKILSQRTNASTPSSHRRCSQQMIKINLKLPAERFQTRSD